jgi:NAD(P)-dependent dehydrogenase (short-subunit alcohol dehydrogenase family)
VTLVTGATGGIGTAICRKFAKLGSFVYICDIKGTMKLADQINEQYEEPRSASVQYDISNKEKVKEMYNQILEEKNGVDILINNAAIHGNGDFPQISYDEFLKTVEVDLSGAIFCTLMAIPQMKKKNWGRILFTGAPLSSSGIPCPYLAGKSGFIGLTKYISEKYKEYDIRTFCLVLRHCDTPMLRRAMKARGKDVEKSIKELNKRSRTGKIISPEEVAEIYAYVTLAKSPRVNGLTLLSDGGITYL